MHWSKPSENRFCERSAKAIGLSEALEERQLAGASRGRRWHTRWISWGPGGSLLNQEEFGLERRRNCLNLGREVLSDSREMRIEDPNDCGWKLLEFRIGTRLEPGTL